MKALLKIISVLSGVALLSACAMGQHDYHQGYRSSGQMAMNGGYESDVTTGYNMNYNPRHHRHPVNNGGYHSSGSSSGGYSSG